MNTTVTGWRRWVPTDKWIATFFTGLGAIVSSWVGTKGFDDAELSMVAALIPALIAAYFVSNKQTVVDQTQQPPRL